MPTDSRYLRKGVQSRPPWGGDYLSGDLKNEEENQAEHVVVDRNDAGRGRSVCKGPELGENLAPLKTIQAKVTDTESGGKGMMQSWR